MIQIRERNTVKIMKRRTGTKAPSIPRMKSFILFDADFNDFAEWVCNHTV